MNERFTMDSTLTDITENERVNRKLSVFFDMQLCEQVKWPFNKMKLKHMMKLIHFPARELVDVSNFIIERREAGEKISIPVWRDLPEEEMDAAGKVVLIPFGAESDEAVPAVLICPGSENGHLKMMTESMEMAERIVQKGCRAFILNIRMDHGAMDMVRAVRFLRANCRKLRIVQEQVAVLAFREACTSALDIFRHDGCMEDVTHRYDGIGGEPNQLWLMEIPEVMSGDGMSGEASDKNSENIFVCREETGSGAWSLWLEDRLDMLKKRD